VWMYVHKYIYKSETCVTNYTCTKHSPIMCTLPTHLCANVCTHIRTWDMRHELHVYKTFTYNMYFADTPMCECMYTYTNLRHESRTICVHAFTHDVYLADTSVWECVYVHIYELETWVTNYMCINIQIWVTNLRHESRTINVHTFTHDVCRHQLLYICLKFVTW